MASPSAAVAAARGRRGGADVQFRWRIDQVVNTVNLSMEKRVKLATAIIFDRIQKNINVPVVKSAGGRVVERSKPGEYPRVETSQLKKTLLTDVEQTSPGVWWGFIGTPLDYGLFLESDKIAPRIKGRSYLVRTLNEERELVKTILTAPIK